MTVHSLSTSIGSKFNTGPDRGITMRCTRSPAPRVVLKWKIYRPDSVIADVIRLVLNEY